jgi:hypothetical protein
MGNRIGNNIVLGSLRYKSSPDVDSSYRISLEQTTKENIEFDRSIDVSLAQIYDDERQKSTIFRPSSKLNYIFKNSYVGEAKYDPFKYSLYYPDVTPLVSNICLGNNTPIYGYPQSYEFDFIRSDDNISGYTMTDINGKFHIKFTNKSATTYNWMGYISYPYENDYTKTLSAVDKKTNTTLNWQVSDGIPFVVVRLNNGIISFRVPFNHGVSVGEFVKLSFDYDGVDTFQVSSLGDGYYQSELTVINIYDIGYTGTTFYDGKVGTLKRVISKDNPIETTSKYYIRKNKIITTENDLVLTKVGFEQLIYKKEKRFDNGVYMPNKQTRISLKESNNVYTITNNKDIDISSLRDNHLRPITELFNTIIWKGYFGWTFGQPRKGGGYHSVKFGYEFNIQPSDDIIKTPSNWWNNNNLNSNTSLELITYQRPGAVLNRPFTYVAPLNVGDVVDGDYCEWNEYELNERVISDCYHKITFNPYYFKLKNSVTSYDNLLGYYYKPHHPITIRIYSNYIEEGDKVNVVGIPDYAVYSPTNQVYRWRDIHTYGYFNENNQGVDYPFFNGVHYPYSDIIFRLIPEGSNYKNMAVAEPKNDNCE